MPTNPITTSPIMGYKVETKFDKDQNVISPSTTANEVDKDKDANPDIFPSTGKSIEEENQVGKGANPSADVVTKNNTTIDPVFREVSPTADGVTVPETVPASLPLNAPVAVASGEEFKVGEPAPVAEGQLYTTGVLKPAETKASTDKNGDVKSTTTKQAEVVFGDEAAKLTADKAEVEAPLPAADAKADDVKLMSAEPKSKK